MSTRLHGFTSHTTVIFRAVAVTAIIIIIIKNNKGSSPVFVPKQPPSKRVPGAFSSEVKRSECEADRSLHLVPKLRMRESTTTFRLEIRVMHRD